MDSLSANRPDAVAALADPGQRALYRFVAASDAPVGRDEASAALGTPRSTVALQLDRLVAAGLLSVEFSRRSGRSGPGAGRPAKLYRAAQTEVLASSPERHYELAADLLASAVERARREGLTVDEAIALEAQETGSRIGAASDTLDAALAACGYDPVADDAHRIVLANCPFHALATRHTEVICAANVALVRGILTGCHDRRDAVLDPAPGRCCVAIRPAVEDAAR